MRRATLAVLLLAMCGCYTGRKGKVLDTPSPLDAPAATAESVLGRAVYFPMRTWELSAAAQVRLDEEVPVLTQNSDVVIEIVGRAEPGDAFESVSADEVAGFRALAAKAYLMDRGVRSHQVVVEPSGSISLPGPVSTAERELYRRVEFEFSLARPPQPITPPMVRQFRNGTHWMLGEPMKYRIRNTSDSVLVPEGFVTNFASIPRPFRGLLQQNGPFTMGAILHDYLYWLGQRDCTRAEADRLFLVAMAESMVPKIERDLMYRAVSGFGLSAWNSNEDERRAGQPRIIPRAHWARIPANSDWPEYRQRLFSQRVFAEQPVPIARQVCGRGQES
jgi:hypothetical protein